MPTVYMRFTLHIFICLVLFFLSCIDDGLNPDSKKDEDNKNSAKNSVVEADTTLTVDISGRLSYNKLSLQLKRKDQTFYTKALDGQGGNLTLKIDISGSVGQTLQLELLEKGKRLTARSIDVKTPFASANLSVPKPYVKIVVLKEGKGLAKAQVHFLDSARFNRGRLGFSAVADFYHANTRYNNLVTLFESPHALLSKSTNANGIVQFFNPEQYAQYDSQFNYVVVSRDTKRRIMRYEHVQFKFDGYSLTDTIRVATFGTLRLELDKSTSSPADVIFKHRTRKDLQPKFRLLSISTMVDLELGTYTAQVIKSKYILSKPQTVEVTKVQRDVSFTLSSELQINSGSNQPHNVQVVGANGTELYNGLLPGKSTLYLPIYQDVKVTTSELEGSTKNVKKEEFTRTYISGSVQKINFPNY